MPNEDNNQYRTRLLISSVCFHILQKYPAA
jgi:hypothetical protein